jgi:uncharacterized membrane protein YhaH (DUF805 family)
MNSTTEQNPFAAPQAAVADREDFADSTFKLNFFSASGRIGRVRYLAYSMGIGLLIMLVGGVLAAITTPMLLIVAYVAMLYMNVMLTIKRSHDFNVSGWLTLLILVPLINLIFLFVPGTDGPNRFGRKTAPNGSTGIVVVVVLFVGIAVVGILAAIAIPAYQSYVQRAHAAQTAAPSVPVAQ